MKAIVSVFARDAKGITAYSPAAMRAILDNKKGSLV